MGKRVAVIVGLLLCVLFVCLKSHDLGNMDAVPDAKEFRIARGVRLEGMKPGLRTIHVNEADMQQTEELYKLFGQ